MKNMQIRTGQEIIFTWFHISVRNVGNFFIWLFSLAEKSMLQILKRERSILREHIPVIIAKHFIRQARTDFLKRGIYTSLILITMSMRREIMHCFQEEKVQRRQIATSMCINLIIKGSFPGVRKDLVRYAKILNISLIMNLRR